MLKSRENDQIERDVEYSRGIKYIGRFKIPEKP